MPKRKSLGKGSKKGLRSGRNKNKGIYTRRFAITERNRITKRRKHIKAQPNDLQTLKLLPHE